MLDLDNTFIYKYRWQIITFVLICTIIYFLCNLNLTGSLESLDPNLAEPIEKYLNKNINLSCMINNSPMYLALTPRSNCLDVQNKHDCSYNIAILQPVKNNYSIFKLDQKLNSSPPIYRLSSQFQGANPVLPRMSFNLLRNKDNKICFDDGYDIEFSLETDNTGLYYIKHENDNKTYYLTSDSRNTCMQKSNNNFLRLSMTNNPKDALGFKLEIVENTEEFDPDNSYGSCISCGTNNLPNNIDTSNYSNLSNYTSLDTQATHGGDIQGFDEYENGSKYMEF